MTERSLLWLTDAGALDEGMLVRHASWLGDSERRRCAHFLRAQRRRQFIVGRTLLRLMAGRLLGVGAAEVVLYERPGRAPVLDLPDAPFLGFSIAHSGRWVACAASLATPLGLDIECIDSSRDVMALAAQAFDAPALARLHAVAPERRVAEFYHLWCLYEAGIKLDGAATADYSYTKPGLAIALRCARPLKDAPRLETVTLDSATDRRD